MSVFNSILQTQKRDIYEPKTSIKTVARRVVKWDDCNPYLSLVEPNDRWKAVVALDSYQPSGLNRLSSQNK